MSNSEERVFGLIAAAEDQQAAVQAALAKLAAQEAALQRERQLLAEAVATVREEAANLRRTAAAVGPELQRDASDAVHGAVTASLANAGNTAARAVEAAVQPLLDRLAGLAAAAQAVEASLRRAVGWVTWRLLGVVVTVVAIGVLLLWLGAGLVEWWTGRQVALDRAQKSVLEAQIAGLQDTHDELVKAGMLAKISRCGAAARLCIRVDEAAGGFGDPADYRIIKGY